MRESLHQIRKHVPELNTPIGVLRLFLLPFILYFLVTAFLDVKILTWPFLPLVVEMVFGGLGFLLLYLFIREKSEFKARFGPLAYSKSARWLAFPGVAIIAAVVVHIRYIPGPEIPRGLWDFVLHGLGWALLVEGALLFLRVVQIFGFDSLIMLYVYFPEESRFVNQKIYNILRHPAYGAAQRIAFGLALLNGNWFAIASAVIFAFGLWGWVSMVEEKELIERIGPPYNEYRRRVPAFWPRLQDLREYIGFLIVDRII